MYVCVHAREMLQEECILLCTIPANLLNADLCTCTCITGVPHVHVGVQVYHGISIDLHVLKFL